jgi:diguanylate cyclase (GGDEF)-like protein
MSQAVLAMRSTFREPEEDVVSSVTAQARSQLIQLQTLVTVVLSYQLLFGPDALLSSEAQRVTLLLLMMICGSLIVLPDWMIGTSWFPATLALIDTGVTTVLVYLSGNASSDLYLTYFVILLIATTARNRKQLFGFILGVCGIYGLVLYKQYMESGVLLEHHLIRIPLLLVMAIFYGGTVETVRNLVDYDSLTGLPNRRSCIRLLTDAMELAHRSRRKLALLSLDLDGFKLINDTMGHRVGDRLLRAVAGRLKGTLLVNHTLARLGGDEFAIIIEDVSSSEQIGRLAQKILGAMGNAYVIQGRETFITATVGIAVYPDDADEPESLIKNADAAMYRAKEEGKDAFEFYAAEMNAHASERLLIESNLRKALERQELLVYYQPKVDLTTGLITGVEALARWQHPEFGLVSPLRFIPVAEDTGLIIPIGEWILRSACAQTKLWQENGFSELHVTVNLSARQLKHPNLTDMVVRVLEETRLEPKSLGFELTESSIMQDAEAMITRLAKLKSLGIELSLDDFGTGYSSLSYLKRFPIDILKIDQAFIRDITSGQDAVAIVCAIIAMAQKLKLRVVAEGVETEAQVAVLREQGCNESQGYVCSQPLPAAEMEQLLREWPQLYLRAKNTV